MFSKDNLNLWLIHYCDPENRGVTLSLFILDDHIRGKSLHVRLHFLTSSLGQLQTSLINLSSLAQIPK